MPRRAFYLPRLSQQIASVLGRLRGQLPEEAQRFGGRAWQTIVARWPALSELSREHKVMPKNKLPRRSALRAIPVAPLPPTSETTDALIAQLMAATSWQARAGAALSLAHHDGREVVQALVRALRDPSVEVAVAAVDALVQHADADTTQALLCALQNQDGYFSPVTRVAAVSALAQRLQSEHFAPVFAAVRDIDAEVSIAAAALITERMPREASAELLHVLRDNSGFYLPIVRLAIANALERAGLLHAGVVGELLESERDPSVRRVLERASHLTGEVAAFE
jgi:HEAT repeat protein